MWLIDKALHHDAFMQQIGHLKELKYKMQRIKMSFTHKMHFRTDKANSSGKMRWVYNKIIKFVSLKNLF